MKYLAKQVSLVMFAKKNEQESKMFQRVNDQSENTNENITLDSSRKRRKIAKCEHKPNIICNGIKCKGDIKYVNICETKTARKLLTLPFLY